MAGQKESNRGKRPKMYYSDNVNTVHVYDVVRIKRGYFIDRLAICTYVNFKTRHLNLTVIENGVQLVLSKSSVEYCYHNTKAAAKQWFQAIDYNVDKLRKLWSDIKYIRIHWYEPLSHNDIAGRAIAKIVNHHISNEDDAISFIEYWANALNIIFVYPDIDFCIKFIRKLERCNYYRDDMIRQIHAAAWRDESISTSPTGEKS